MPEMGFANDLRTGPGLDFTYPGPVRHMKAPSALKISQILEGLIHPFLLPFLFNCSLP